MKFFSYDGILAQIIRYIWNLFVLNLCTIVCCSPIVTAGAAITALYSVYLNESMASSRIFQYFRAFKENFRQSTLIWLVFLGFSVVIGMDVYLLLTYDFSGNAVLKILTVIVATLGMSVGSFIFPLVAHYENSNRQTWRNAFVLGVSLFPYGVVMTVISLLPIFLFFVNLDVMVIVLAIWIPLGGALSAQINSWILKHVFHRLQSMEDSATS